MFHGGPHGVLQQLGEDVEHVPWHEGEGHLNRLPRSKHSSKMQRTSTTRSKCGNSRVHIMGHLSFRGLMKETVELDLKSYRPKDLRQRPYPKL